MKVGKRCIICGKEVGLYKYCYGLGKAWTAIEHEESYTTKIYQSPTSSQTHKLICTDCYDVFIKILKEVMEENHVNTDRR